MSVLNIILIRIKMYAVWSDTKWEYSGNLLSKSEKNIVIVFGYYKPRTTGD